MDLSGSDIFVDLGAQRDYMGQGAIRPCTNSLAMSANIRHLMALARWARLPVISCVDGRRENQIDDEVWVRESRIEPEQRKAPYTLLPDHAVVEPDNCLCISLNVLQQHQQIIFTKYTRDPFTNPKLDRLLTEMPARRFVVFGLPLESSVRIMVLGLVRRGRRVGLVEDAAGFWSQQEANMVLRQLRVKGCEILHTESLLRQALHRSARPLRCQHAFLANGNAGEHASRNGASVDAKPNGSREVA